ncbi:MAG: glycine--tRNA ligase subunit beta [Betaproteobacteria bacterium]|nr:glycine--tRNA ligase subunit beta [Betaproteobacteria bacterium]
MGDALLVELLTEELPPKSLQTLGARFAEGIGKRIKDLGFAPAQAAVTPFATPRRLGVLVADVAGIQPERSVERKGPAVSSGMGADGKPTQALLGFARSCGVAVEQLARMNDGKAEHFVFRSTKAGEALSSHLAGIVQQTIKELPIPKMMRWGNREDQFVRPVHGLIMLHGTQVVEGSVLGLRAGGHTRGHRFLSEGSIKIEHASQYEATLAQRGAVVASFVKRRDLIHAMLASAAGEAQLGEAADLLNEVTALVEGPIVYEARFGEAFLAVPQECLILSMKQHQKYFPLLDKQTGKLLNRFLIVSNLKTDDPSQIIQGNERVLRARLSDAKFFFDQDRKTPLAERAERLGQVVYHNKLGSQLERVHRISKLAVHIAEKLGVDATKAERAARLCKADLITGMVGEFPELQGIMGQYYALHDGESADVARAIEAHYHPRFANDSLPDDHLGCAVALADKLDTLVGIFGIGMQPSGDRDPFGLRRQALGILRILVEKALPLDFVELLQVARSQFPGGMLADSVVQDIHPFALDRLRGYLREREFTVDEIEAVVGQNPVRMDQVLPRMEAVRAFRAFPEAQSLAAANKRIRNILKKTEVKNGTCNVALFQEDAERALFGAVNALAPQLNALVASASYTQALRLLAGLSGGVDTFFDKVMVMAEDASLRDNRLALLSQLETLMNQVADISKLAA